MLKAGLEGGVLACGRPVGRRALVAMVKRPNG